MDLPPGITEDSDPEPTTLPALASPPPSRPPTVHTRLTVETLEATNETNATNITVTSNYTINATSNATDSETVHETVRRFLVAWKRPIE